MNDERPQTSSDQSEPPRRDWTDRVTTVFVLLIGSTLLGTDNPSEKFIRIAGFAFIPSALIAIFLTTRYGERQRVKHPGFWQDAPFASLCIVGTALTALAIAGVLF